MLQQNVVVPCPNAPPCSIRAVNSGSVMGSPGRQSPSNIVHSGAAGLVSPQARPLSVHFQMGSCPTA